MKQPAFAVVIPTYNRHGLLLRAVQSVFTQTCLPKELIVVDDGSDPPLDDRIFDHAPKKVKCLKLRNKSPMGAAATRNRGVSEASATWIAFLDDDDAFLPGKLQHISQAIARNPQVKVFYHPATICMVKEKISYRSGVRNINKCHNPFNQLIMKNLVGGSSMVVIKKDVFLENGGFDEKLIPIEDYDLWIRLYKKGNPFLYVNKPLTTYYHDTKGDSLTHSFEMERMAQSLLREKHAADYAALSTKEKRILQRNQLRSQVFKALLNGNIRMAKSLQTKLFFHSMRPIDLVILLLMPLGLKAIFRLRSMAANW